MKNADSENLGLVIVLKRKSYKTQKVDLLHVCMYQWSRYTLAGKAQKSATNLKN